MNIADEKKILVVAAHPDDEMLGCGGTLARCRSLGIPASILLLGEGPAARMDASAARCHEISRTQAVRAAATVGISDVRFAGLPDNRFDTLPLLDIVKIIESHAQEIRPTLIFTHFAGDLNIDHQLTHRAVITALRPLPDAPAYTILGFEVLSSTEYATPGIGDGFYPQYFVDIAEFIPAKAAALACYSEEMRPWPHPRSQEGVEHLARLRGAQCGRNAAEGFVLYRKLW